MANNEIREKPSKPKVQQRGIMNKMRDKMPVIIIFIIVAFLGTIIFEWGMNYLGISGTGRVPFATINGEEITYQEYLESLNSQIQSIQQQNEGKEIDDKTMIQIREQVWNSIVQRKLIQQEINKLGISVTKDEVKEWVYQRPETLPQWLKNFFTDSTGVFRTDMMYQTLQDKRPEISKAWTDIERELYLQLEFEKFQNIISSSVIVTEGEVLQKYKDENIFADFEFVLLSTNTITDTNINNVSEEELRAYYEEHKNDFRQEEAVKLKYVIFQEFPSPEDSAFVGKLLATLTEDLKAGQIEDSSLIKLVNDNSEESFNDEFRKAADFQLNALNFLFGAKIDSVSGVITDMDAYRIVRLLDVKEGDEEFVNADHILVNLTEQDSAGAKFKAEEILKKARSGQDFNELAFTMSDDQSAKQNRGNLGWFNKGKMVKEFEDAVFRARIGDIVGPVKTQFGYHIIKVNNRSKKEFKVAEIKKTVSVSEITRNALRNKARDFWRDLDEGIKFDSVANNFKLQVSQTPEITKSSGMIPGAGQNKALFNFAFKNKVGSFIEPVKVQGGYGIYEITEKIPEGYKNFDSIKTTMIKPLVVQEKIYERLKQAATELRARIQGGNLMSLKPLYTMYNFDTADSVSVSKPNSIIGLDYGFFNAAFKLQNGEISEPIRGNNGYYIVKMLNITPFNEQDYNIKSIEIRKQMMATKQQSAIQEYMSKLQNDADIEDNRELYM
ncbi:MAG: peptidylprolyl isomerase [Ignavibacteria bacterium]|nr:peptidylprolyl isomerase [Ignavibacteria bacterium]